MYKVTHSKHFSDQLKKLSSYSRIEELQKAIDWSLQHNPRSAHKIEENYYLWVTDRLPVKTVPRVKIVYKVDDKLKEVVLISIAEQVDPNLS